MEPQTQNPIQPQEDLSNPIELAKKVLQIEYSLKEGISSIQEILAIIVQDKIDLEKIKSMAKNNLQTMANE